METLTISSLRKQSYIAENTDHHDEYKSEYFVFNIFGVTYWAGVHTTTVEPEGQIFVMYERHDYDFQNLEDAVCFSLGGSIVQEVADDYKHYHKQDDNVYNEEKFVELAHGIINTLEYNLQITDKQADKLKEGAEEYARVWL